MRHVIMGAARYVTIRQAELELYPLLSSPLLARRDALSADEAELASDLMTSIHAARPKSLMDCIVKPRRACELELVRAFRCLSPEERTALPAYIKIAARDRR